MTACPRQPLTLPSDRLAIGQLLVRLLHEFRVLHVRGLRRAPSSPTAIRRTTRSGAMSASMASDLTELAHKANLSLAACSELVNDLQSLGYRAAS